MLQARTVTITVDNHILHGEEFGNGRGIFTAAADRTAYFYVGQFNEQNEAHGYGLCERSEEAHLGQFANGKWDGYKISHRKESIVYELYSQGNRMHWATEYKSWSCSFDGNPCDANEAFTDLKTKALEAEVRCHPAALTPPPSPAHHLRSSPA